MMSQKTQPADELRLVKIKSWYIPADAAAYQSLRAAKVPMLKVHKGFIPTLFLATKKAKLKPISIPFADILNSYLDKIGSSWKAKEGRNCRLNDSRLTFSAPLTKANREAMAKLDIALAKFFERWAHRYIPTYSTTDDRMKLVVDYSFDPARDPVIRAVEEPKPKTYDLDLGFTRIRFTLHDGKAPARGEGQRKSKPPLIQTEVFVLAGTEWRLQHTSTCLASQIGDLSQFMTVMALLHSKREVEDQ